MSGIGKLDSSLTAAMNRLNEAAVEKLTTAEKLAPSEMSQLTKFSGKGAATESKMGDDRTGFAPPPPAPAPPPPPGIRTSSGGPPPPPGNFGSSVGGTSAAAAQQPADPNAQLSRQHADLDQQIAFNSQMKDALMKVTTHGLAGDTYLSKQELLDLSASSDPAQRAAAEFILKNWDRLPVPKYAAWGGGMNTNEMRAAAMQVGALVDQLQEQKRKLAPLPASSPTTGGTPATSSSAQTATGATTDATPPKPAEGSKTPELDKVPPFRSTAEAGEGRLTDAIDHMQLKMDALEKDMAAAGDNPALLHRLNAEYQKMQSAQSMFMQLLKQRSEMMNSISKLYSDMAMSSIRNMR